MKSAKAFLYAASIMTLVRRIARRSWTLSLVLLVQENGGLGG